VLNRKSLPLFLIAVVILTGCSANADENANGANETEISAAETAWLEACEADYKSSDCRSKTEKNLLDFDNGQNLYAHIEPYSDYKKSSECITNPEGDSCSGLRIFTENQITDLRCEEIQAFGYGYFCWGEITVRNMGSRPIDDYVEASIYDVDGNEFAADVEGSFNFGLSIKEFARSVNVQLNPEKVSLFPIGFSVPDIKRQYTHISLRGYDEFFSIPLCRKNSGDMLEIAKSYVGKVAIYENARLLNSCKYENGVYINRLDGSMS
jgi:hypothetical protein